MIPEKGKYYRCKNNNIFGFTRDHIYLSKKDCELVSDNDVLFESESSRWEDLFEEVTPDVVDAYRKQNKVHEGLVNHPLHYTSHPSGIECITIARHYCFAIGNAIKYLWRAGLKKDMGKSDREKEIEDLEKAKWYIQDRINELKNKE